MERTGVDGTYHLCLFATKDIKVGKELRYNYDFEGQNFPWRSKRTNFQNQANEEERKVENRRGQSQAMTVRKKESKTGDKYEENQALETEDGKDQNKVLEAEEMKNHSQILEVRDRKEQHQEPEDEDGKE